MTAHLITTRNVNTALRAGLHWLALAGQTSNSRNGPVLVAPGPVITAYEAPQERVLFSALRDANPFFHLYECIWMLAGRNDAASVARYAKTMASFADDGTLAGSYGYRWRRHFGFDQLPAIVEMLRKDPSTRRAVLSMFDPVTDLQHGAGSKDIPCNTAVYFGDTRGVLDMTVVNRSNDIVWGAYGANAVHMSFLQEVIACAAGLPLGTYYQFSNNFHSYTDRPDVQRLLGEPDPAAVRPSNSRVKYTADDRYGTNLGERAVTAPVTFTDLRWFLEDCQAVCDDWDLPDGQESCSPFLNNVVLPMMQAHVVYKTGAPNADNPWYAELCKSQIDWHVAGREWLDRRAVNKEQTA